MKLGKTRRVHEIRLQTIKAIVDGNPNPSGYIQEEFGLSRTAASSHLKWLTSQGFLSSSGKTRATQYHLGDKRYYEESFTLDGAAEHDVYNTFSFVFEHCKKNVVDICYYGITEMVNNAIDHSSGESVAIEAYCDTKTIEVEIFDNGIGIFQHIARELALSDPREAILELHKGKLTTDPDHHTGEGIFFTSRAFDEFSIHSDNRTFSHSSEQREDWLFNFGDAFKGTLVVMKISAASKKSLKALFDKFASGDDYAFDTTIVPVVQLLYNDEPLLSRSQAKRLLNRLDRFKQIILDFNGISFIGQGFADEVFRVFQSAHPEIRVEQSNANPDVLKMIDRARHRTGKNDRQS